MQGGQIIIKNALAAIEISNSCSHSNEGLIKIELYSQRLALLKNVYNPFSPFRSGWPEPNYIGCSIVVAAHALQSRAKSCHPTWQLLSEYRRRRRRWTETNL